MFNLINSIVHRKTSICEMDEQAKHLLSEKYLKKHIKLSYENALNELITFIKREDNLDLVEQILKGDEKDPDARQVINIALNKRDGNIYVHINNSHQINSDKPIGVVYKSHIENNDTVWEIFCEVILFSDPFNGLEYINKPESYRPPNTLEFNCDIECEHLSIHDKIFDDDIWETNYNNYFSIDKFKNLKRRTSPLSTSKAVCVASPLFTKINMDHVYERILSQANPIKGAHKV